MSIIYALVANGSNVLAEHAAVTGNASTVAGLILEKIDSTRNEMRSYVYNRHIFHYSVDDGLVFMCMADEDMSRRIPFAFLADIKNRWKATYGQRGRNAMAYGMNDSFAGTLSKQMDYFSNNPDADRLNQIRGGLDDVRNVMVSNIEKVLERGERIELLVDRTDNLQSQAFQFKKKSTQLKRAMWWKNMKLTLIIAAVVVILLYIIISAACGGLNWPKCVKKKKSSGGAPAPTPAPSPSPPPTFF